MVVLSFNTGSYSEYFSYPLLHRAGQARREGGLGRARAESGVENTY